MSRRRMPQYELAMIYDTETCNMGKDNRDAVAFPILFIENDVRGVDMRYYNPDKDGKVYFYRHEKEFLKRIDEYIEYGKFVNKIPIICGYNLMFDLQPLMEELDKKFRMRICAQSSTNVYTLDLLPHHLPNSNIPLLRFWDTFHLEMRGLAAMGKTAGLKKATGDWDYSLIRTPETPLTEEELFYAKRDVEVIPAYFRYLLEANEWMEQKDLGVRVLTKTGIVRTMAKRQIAQIKIGKKDGKDITVDWAFVNLCKKCLPSTFSIYALRKSCFYGGWTFTSARYASTVVTNVLSADVTSMHHAFLNGRMVPDDFKVKSVQEILGYCREIVTTPTRKIMEHYEKPFRVAIHARLKFTNVRMKKGSCFEYWGLALEPLSKFMPKLEPGNEYAISLAANEQENYLRGLKWINQANNAEFAFGKMYACDECIMHFNEIELWCFSQVYDFDTMECLCGEASTSFVRPPDYVALQSNILYKRKDAAKKIHATYRKGVMYTMPIDKTIPDGIAEMLKSGECSEQFFASYYNSTVKGMFNGIY